MKSKLFNILLLLFIVIFASCTKQNNFPPPDSGIYGNLIDAETNRPLILSQGQGVIRLLEQNKKYPNPAPLDLPVNSASGYNNTMEFAGQYKVFPLAHSGPFTYPSTDTLLVDLKPGHQARADFYVIPFFRIDASVADSVFTYTITSSNENANAGGQLNQVYFLISPDSALNMGAAGNPPGSYYPNQFPLSNVSNGILGAQQTYTLPFASTRLPKGTYWFRVCCTGTRSDGQYNYSKAIQATVH